MSLSQVQPEPSTPGTSSPVPLGCLLALLAEIAIAFGMISSIDGRHASGGAIGVVLLMFAAGGVVGLIATIMGTAGRRGGAVRQVAVVLHALVLLSLLFLFSQT